VDQNASAEDRDTVALVAAIDPNRQVGAGPLDVYGLTTTKSRCENGLVCGYWRLKWSLLVPKGSHMHEGQQLVRRAAIDFKPVLSPSVVTFEFEPLSSEVFVLQLCPNAVSWQRLLGVVFAIVGLFLLRR